MGAVLLEYIYHDVGVTLRHRSTGQLVAYLDYALTVRDDPAFPLRHFQTWEVDLAVDLDLTRYWGLWGGYGYLNQSSTDPRYDYDRHQVELGARFTFRGRAAMGPL